MSVTIAPGVEFYSGWLDRAAQEALLAELRVIVDKAPLFRPRMPRTGQPFSVEMTNCGALGWVSDKAGGYRYQANHPQTDMPWPQMPEVLTSAWQQLAHYALPAEACLINFYAMGAKMGLHQDRDEGDFAAPVVSLSLGDTGVFRIGGTKRGGATRAVKLESGDALVFGGPARLAFHGIDRVIAGSSTLIEHGGRINLTLRRVSGGGTAPA